MTVLSDFRVSINNWLNRDKTDAEIDEWIAMGQDRISEDLRIADQVQIDTATIAENRVSMPTDWLEADFIRPVGGKALEYVTREELYNLSAADAANKYSISGNYIIFGGTYDPTVEMEMTYYGRVPDLIANPDGTWLITKHRQLLLFSVLTIGTAFGIEDERAGMWTEYVTNRIDKLNENHTIAKTSGSMLRGRRSRSFG